MKLNLTEEQKEKLRAGYRRALEIPEGFDMSEWVKLSTHAPCGTAVCYAGELCIVLGEYEPAKLLDPLKLFDQSIPDEAARLVGLSYAQICELFFLHTWPAKFAKRFNDATSPRKEAEVLRDVVEHFIATDGDMY